MRRKKERSVLVVWSEFAKTLLKAKVLWEEFCEMARSLPSLDDLPIEAQEIFSRVSIWSNFENALKGMISYWASQGGLEVFQLTIDEEEEEGEELSDE